MSESGKDGAARFAAADIERTPRVVSDADIARRAYEIYLERGGTHGADFDDWLAAERELRTTSRPESGNGLADAPPARAAAAAAGKAKTPRSRTTATKPSTTASKPATNTTKPAATTSKPAATTSKPIASPTKPATPNKPAATPSKPRKSRARGPETEGETPSA
jgi:hypothetical protein